MVNFNFFKKTISLFTILFIIFSITVFASANTVMEAEIKVNNNEITVLGNISGRANEKIALLLLNNLGNISYIQELYSDENGDFSHIFLLPYGSGEGAYTLYVGVPSCDQKKVFSFYYTENSDIKEKGSYFAIGISGYDNLYEHYILTQKEIDTLGYEGTALKIKNFMDKLPDGARSITLSGDINYHVSRNHENYIWWENGVQLSKDTLEPLWEKYIEIGGPEIDSFFIDFEHSCNITTQERANAILSDPRYKTEIHDPLSAMGYVFPCEMTGTQYEDKDDLYFEWGARGAGFDDSQKSKNYWIMRDFLTKRTNNYLEQAYYYPAKKYFPNIIFSNYDMADYNEDSTAVTQHGFKLNKKHKVGTHSAPDLYGLVISNMHIYTGYKYGQFLSTPYNSFISTIIQLNEAKKGTVDGNITPWIGSRSYDGSDLTGSQCNFANTDYYNEMVLHTGLYDPDYFLYFNYKTPDEVNKILSNLISELNEVVGTDDRFSLKSNNPGWNDRYVLTGMYSGGKNVWRITPDISFPGMTKDKFLYDEENIIFKIGDRYIDFPEGSYILTPDNEYSSYGYWVVSPEETVPYEYGEDTYTLHTPYTSWNTFYSNKNQNELISLVGAEDKLSGSNDAVINKSDYTGWQTSDSAFSMSGAYEEKHLEYNNSYDVAYYNNLEKITNGLTTLVWEIDVKLPSVEKNAQTEIFRYSDRYNDGKLYPIVLKNGGAYSVRDINKSDEYTAFVPDKTLKSDTWYKVVRVISSNLKTGNEAEVYTKDYIYDTEGNLIGSTGDEWWISGISECNSAIAGSSSNSVSYLFKCLSLYVKGYTKPVDFDNFAVYNDIPSYEAITSYDKDNTIIEYNPISVDGARSYIFQNLSINHSTVYRKYHTYYTKLMVPEFTDDGVISLFYNTISGNSHIDITKDSVSVNAYDAKNSVFTKEIIDGLILETGKWYDIKVNSNLEDGASTAYFYDEAGNLIKSYEYNYLSIPCPTTGNSGLKINFFCASGFSDKVLYFDDFGIHSDTSSFMGSEKPISWKCDGGSYVSTREKNQELKILNHGYDLSYLLPLDEIIVGNYHTYNTVLGSMYVVRENQLTNGKVYSGMELTLNFDRRMYSDSILKGIILKKDGIDASSSISAEYSDTNNALTITFSDIEIGGKYTLSFNEYIMSDLYKVPVRKSLYNLVGVESSESEFIPETTITQKTVSNLVPDSHAIASQVPGELEVAVGNKVTGWITNSDRGFYISEDGFLSAKAPEHTIEFKTDESVTNDLVRYIEFYLPSVTNGEIGFFGNSEKIVIKDGFVYSLGENILKDKALEAGEWYSLYSYPNGTVSIEHKGEILARAYTGGDENINITVKGFMDTVKFKNFALYKEENSFGVLVSNDDSRILRYKGTGDESPFALNSYSIGSYSRDINFKIMADDYENGIINLIGCSLSNSNDNPTYILKIHDNGLYAVGAESETLIYELVPGEWYNIEYSDKNDKNGCVIKLYRESGEIIKEVNLNDKLITNNGPAFLTFVSVSGENEKTVYLDDISLKLSKSNCDDIIFNCDGEEIKFGTDKFYNSYNMLLGEDLYDAVLDEEKMGMFFNMRAQRSAIRSVGKDSSFDNLSVNSDIVVYFDNDVDFSECIKIMENDKTFDGAEILYNDKKNLCTIRFNTYDPLSKYSVKIEKEIFTSDLGKVISLAEFPLYKSYEKLNKICFVDKEYNEVQGASKGDTLIAEAELLNEKADYSANIIIAVYSQNRLMELYSTPVIIKSGNHIVYSDEFNVNYDNCTLKTFMLDSFDNLKPFEKTNEIIVK